MSKQRELERKEFLAEVNAMLAERNLKTLAKLGDVDKGEIELIAVEDVLDGMSRFHTDVRFKCVFPGGGAGSFQMRWNANSAVADGAVFVPVVNGNVAVVKQWRPTLGKWTYELPRGFGESLDKAKINGQIGQIKIADLPLNTLFRELGEEVMESAEVSSVTFLGNVAENSGTHTVAPAFYMVNLKVDQQVLEQRLKGTEEGIKVQLWTLDKVRSELGGKLNDLHTIGAVALALKHLSELPR
ncbi:MAG: hypothetical protein Q8O88_02105 [bacterium]|nr:hypothetical protein [bacterium]